MKQTKQHIKRHAQFHACLEKLVKDFMETTIKNPACWTITGLREWAKEQANPAQTIENIGSNHIENK